jgi:CheY-like chemotaxis protein
MVEKICPKHNRPTPASVTMPTLLIVEDESAFRQFISLALHMEGYQVCSVESGERAIEVLQDVPPDLVILDLSLPCISGWDVLHFMRSVPHLTATPVLVLTANADENTRRRCQREHVDRLLVKPASLNDILDAIERALAIP